MYINDINVYKKDNMQLTTYTVTHKTLKFFPTDGVVFVKFQKASPGVNHKNIDKMPGDNHFQMRNSPETKTVIETI